MKLRYDYFMSMLCCLGMMFFTTANLNAQECICQNSTSYLTNNAPTVGGIEVSLLTCAFTSEYTTINNVVAGETYIGTAQMSGNNIHLTVRSGSFNGPVLACGISPVSFTATANESVYFHFHDDAACTASSGCVVSTITCTSCPTLEAPANNDCASPITLIPEGGACTNTVSGTTLGSTDSEEADPDCSAGGLNGGDVWYQFTATSSTHLITFSNVSAELGAGSTMASSLYQGSCGSLVEVAGTCGSSNTSRIVSGLTPGESYLLRVWTINTTAGQASSFDLCIGTPPPPPSNNECFEATVLAVNSGGECMEVTAGTTLSSSNSEVPVTCTAGGGGVVGGDIWYQFTATNSTHFIIISDVVNVLGGVFNTVTAVYEGACGELTQVSGSCASAGAGTRVVNDLMPGMNYYVRVWTSSTATSQANSFNICIGTPPPPPPNNECFEATVLAVNAGEECAAPTAGTTLSSTNSNETAPTCSQNGVNGGDVWYQFTATSSIHNIVFSDVENVLGGVFAMGAAVYTGACGELTQINCSNSGLVRTLLDLNIGQTYYIRVYTTSTAVAQANSFNICITTPVIPAGSFCSDPIVIPPNLPYTTEDNTSNYGNFFTGTPGPAAECGSGSSYLSGDEVFYSFTASSNMSINISMTPTATWSGIFVYGSCADVGVSCLAGVANSTTNERLIENFLLTEGQTIIIAISTWPTPQNTGYTLVITENTCVAPVITSEVIEDCANNEYSVLFTMVTPGSNMGAYGGSATVGGETFVVENALANVADATFLAGPFPIGVEASLSLVAEDVNCSGPLGTFNFNLADCPCPAGSATAGLFPGDVCTPTDPDAVAGVVSESCTCNDVFWEGCVESTFSWGSAAPVCDGDPAVVENAWANESTPVSVTEGDIYTFTTATYTPNPSAIENFYITLATTDDDIIALGFGSLVWTATFTGTVRFYTNDVPTCPGNYASSTAHNRVVSAVCGASFECPDLEADNGDPCSVDGNDGIVIDCECAIFDCADVAGGTAFIDECGDCVGGTTELEACEADCDGVFGGTAFIDDCGDCVGGDTGEEACVEDCDGVFGGTAFIDECGDCVGGDTGLDACVEDCDGVFGGTAFIDECGDCVGGDTGEEACVEDCDGVFGGTAFIDECGDCVGGDTGMDACEQDCAGVFGGTAEIDECGVCLEDGPMNPDWNTSCADCAGVPNGPGEIDDCGVCIADGPTGSTWNATCTDCAGVVNGTAFIDNCGDCVGGTTGLEECEADCFGVLGGEGIFDDCGVCRLPGDPDFNATCTDCNGVVNGSAFVDECGDCVGGDTGEVACEADCAGVFGGTAFIDECGDCVGGTTELDACVQDCAGVFGGTAFIDDCGDCVGGTTGMDACAEDCAGVFGGTAFIDECGDCVGGTTGMEACVEDCAGVFGGDAEIDDCGVCIAGGSSSPDWNASCTDCAGVLNGTAFIDNCGDCVGGNTGLDPCSADCLGVPGGDAEVDDCGVCYANGPANPNWNSTCTDCAGVVNGTAFVDNCGDCVGGTTGIDACVADCLGVFGGNAEVDACGDCWANGPANPSWNLACTDCAGVVNGTSEIDPCGDCILDGPANPLWGAACAGEIFTLSGTITTADGDPIQAATASLAGYTASSNAGGMFSLEAMEGTSGTLTAMKDENPRNGISTFDLVLIQRHILGAEYFTSPYQKVAADANKNNMIEVGDILMIQQLLIFNTNDFVDPFSGDKVNTSWRMVKPGLTDPNPTSAMVPTVSDGYAISDLDGNQTGLNFVAVKIGDVNMSANPNNIDAGNFDQSLNWRSPWFWTTDDLIVQNGQTYEIQIAGMNDEAFNGFQTAIHTQGLNIISINGENLRGWNANNSNILSDDLALISWFSNGAAQQRGEVLFTLTVEATASGKLSDMISLEHELLATEAYAFDHSHAPVQLVFNEIQGETPTRLTGSYPNPFNVETAIGFYTDVAEAFEISIYDMHGKRVHFDVINTTAGYNEWTWKPAAGVHAGFFIFKLQNNTEVLQGKLIFID